MGQAKGQAQGPKLFNLALKLISDSVFCFFTVVGRGHASRSEVHDQALAPAMVRKGIAKRQTAAFEAQSSS